MLNKVDAVEDRSLLDVLLARYPNAIAVSAVERQGFDQLARAIAERLAGGYDEYEISAYPGHGKLLMFLKERAEILSETHDDSQYTVRCRIPRRFAWMLKQLDGITITPATESVPK